MRESPETSTKSPTPASSTAPTMVDGGIAQKETPPQDAFREILPRPTDDRGTQTDPCLLSHQETGQTEEAKDEDVDPEAIQNSTDITASSIPGLWAEAYGMIKRALSIELVAEFENLVAELWPKTEWSWLGREDVVDMDYRNIQDAIDGTVKIWLRQETDDDDEPLRTATSDNKDLTSEPIGTSSPEIRRDNYVAWVAASAALRVRYEMTRPLCSKTCSSAAKEIAVDDEQERLPTTWPRDECGFGPRDILHRVVRRASRSVIARHGHRRERIPSRWGWEWKIRRVEARSPAKSRTEESSGSSLHDGTDVLVVLGYRQGPEAGAVQRR
jgi:hypothetical protein